MTELSPAAQAVFWAFNSKFDWIEDGVPGSQCRAVAAALRAAVEQCTYRDAWEDKFLSAERILAIAAELEAQ